MASVEIRRGTLSLVIPESLVLEALGPSALETVPIQCLECRKERDGDAGTFHLTILTAKERKAQKSAEEMDMDLDTDFTVLGLGSVSNQAAREKVASDLQGCPQAYYLIVHYPAGDLLRKLLKLPEKDFHITLGFAGKDLHEVRKGISTLFRPIGTECDWIPAFLESIQSSKLILKKYLEVLEYILSLPEEDSHAEALFSYAKLLGASGDHGKSLKAAERLLDLDPTRAFFIQLKISKYLGLPLEDLFSSIRATLIGSSNSASPELETVLEELNKFDGLSKTAYIFDSQENKVLESKVPHNLSSIDDRVWGSGMITNSNIRAVIGYYKFQDIVTLTEEPLTLDEAYQAQIRVHHFPMRDRFPPEAPETMDAILGILESSPKALVHCLGGVGRTNTVIACYLIRFKGQSPAEAISFIDSNRKMKLSGEQVTFIKEFYNRIHKKAGAGTAEGALKKELTKCIMLVGSPCSGKSTLSERFVSKYGSAVLHINQDELGKRECVRFFIDNLKNTKTLILDRCNGTQSQRKEWLEYLENGGHGQGGPVCIFFNLPLRVCEERLAGRKGHLTLTGPNAAKILRTHYKGLEPPKLREGFSSILTVSDDETYTEILKAFDLLEPSVEEVAATEKFIKFPRTRHAINLGSATRDDLLMTSGELESLLEGPIVVEEKIDGANLGISIDSTGEIRVQNRSHYVNEATHPQFKLLRVWIENHREALQKVIQPGNQVLFGEWAYAKHSIHYTRLPDYFLAYDLYTISTESFASRAVLDELLTDTGLSQVPKIGEGRYSREELTEMVSSRVSAYSDSIVEGLYLRTTSKDLTQTRGKVVRVGFIAGNEHWTKYKVQRNTLDPNVEF